MVLPAVCWKLGDVGYLYGRVRGTIERDRRCRSIQDRYWFGSCPMVGSVTISEGRLQRDNGGMPPVAQQVCLFTSGSRNSRQRWQGPVHRTGILGLGYVRRQELPIHRTFWNAIPGRILQHLQPYEFLVQRGWSHQRRNNCG